MQSDHSHLFSNIAQATISPKGIFKYILIQAEVQKAPKKYHYFVRGDQHQQYHADNFNQFVLELKAKGFQIIKHSNESGTCLAKKDNFEIKFKCPGGGRIEHNYGGKKCFIYGYSKSYGHVDHKIAQQILSESLGYGLNEIETSKEGY